MSCERHSATKPPSASCVTLKTISMWKAYGIRTAVSTLENAGGFQRRAQHFLVLRVHRHEREAIFLGHRSHHRERGFHRNGIGFDEQVFEQRIEFCVQLLR